MKRAYAYDVARAAKKRRLARPATYYKGKPSRRVAPAQVGFVRNVGYYGRFAGANQEKKFFDTTKGLTSTATAGTIFNNSLVIIPEGNGESDRVGRRITIRSMHFHGTITIPSTATAADTSDSVRVIVYCDKQTNGAAAAVTDILESAAYNSFNNLANRNRFQIIMDKKMAIACAAGSGRGSTDTLSYGENQRWWKLHKKGMSTQIEYDNSATTGAITTQRSNNYGVLVISQSAKSTIGYVCRIRYTDN